MMMMRRRVMIEKEEGGEAGKKVGAEVVQVGGKQEK